MPLIVASVGNSRPQHLPALLLLLLLSACGQQHDSGTPAKDRCAGGDNLVRDARFETLNAPRLQRAWLSSQHSTDLSLSLIHISEPTRPKR